MATKFDWKHNGRRVGFLLIILFCGVGLTLTLAFLAGFFKEKVPVASGSPSEGGRVFTGATAEVVRMKIPRHETAVGTVRAVHESAVASKLLARVMEINVKARQTVTKNDVLVRLDDQDLLARLSQAEAGLESAKAVLTRANADLQRAETLIKSRAIEQSQYDAAVSANQVAQAEVRRGEQAIAEAKVFLDYTVIRAPLTGVIIDKKIEVGDTANPGQILVTLYEPNRMQLVASVRESLALKLKVGDTVPAALDAIEHSCMAEISEIVPEAESGSRSFTVKVTGPCPPGAVSGMFGRITIPLEDEEIVVVPTNAVYKVGQLTMVDVVSDKNAYRRIVQLGRELQNGFEVLSGVRAGEKVALRITSNVEEK